jgi:hypothetical protein
MYIVVVKDAVGYSRRYYNKYEPHKIVKKHNNTNAAESFKANKKYHKRKYKDIPESEKLDPSLKPVRQKKTNNKKEEKEKQPQENNDLSHMRPHDNAIEVEEEEEREEERNEQDSEKSGDEREEGREEKDKEESEGEEEEEKQEQPKEGKGRSKKLEKKVAKKPPKRAAATKIVN